MQYDVKMTRKAIKGVEKLPRRNREILVRLLCDIRDFGPVQPKHR
jgi:mRNA-degrading endonuclease RelE of RelBE toxin-antitoxin system